MSERVPAAACAASVGSHSTYRGCGRCRRRADQTQSVSRAVLKFLGYLIPAEAVSVIRDVVSDCAVADPYGLPNGDGRFVPTAAMVLRRQRCGHPRDVRSKDQELISSRQPVESAGPTGRAAHRVDHKRGY